MSRPSSARPKTSSGRAPSAAVRRPPSSTGQAPLPPPPMIPRPMSRSVHSRAGPEMMERPPTSQRNMMTQQYVGHPPTGLARPPTSSSRPMTGFQGARTQSRMGTAGQRQVFDKSYFMGLLRAKMGQLNAEIGKLEEVCERGRKDRMELTAYEKTAEESALALKFLQGQLIDLNVLIDKMHMNSDLSHIDIEAKRVKEQADELDTVVQDLFADRQQKEHEAEQIMMAIEDQKRRNQSKMDGMEAGTRERYETAKQTADDLRADVAQMQEEVNGLDDRRTQLELELDNSPLKKKAVQMHETLSSLQQKEQKLKEEEALQETPEQKKAKLIDQMRQNNEDIATMEKQISTTLEEVESASTNLLDFEKDGAQLAHNNQRFRDLTKKEQEVDEFLKTYPEEKHMMVAELEEYREAIVMNLKKISKNLEKVSIESKVTDMDPTGIIGNVLHEKATPKELQDVHVRLQEEMLSIEEMESNLSSDIESLTKRTRELEIQAHEYANVDKLSVDTENTMKELEEKLENLRRVVPPAEEKHETLSSRLRDIQMKLDDDPNFSSQRSLMNRLEMLNESNEEIRKSLAVREAETNYETIKEQVMTMRQEYNDILLASTQRK